ncbi:hypothetical protein L596_015129 [Steinernema carpocapsae]|uniref:Uncharacterized protein n=1 Tax=Steinernema carpocapsae TaxID=34508 RepID=A0A4U5NE23_STECR|nr:hypothetical protein L596_015129 [Steinernema carpocapsae]
MLKVFPPQSVPLEFLARLAFHTWIISPFNSSHCFPPRRLCVTEDKDGYRLSGRGGATCGEEESHSDIIETLLNEETTLVVSLRPPLVMSTNQLLQVALVWLGFVCIIVSAQIDDVDSTGVAIDPATLARYRMYAYGNLLKRSDENAAGNGAKFSLYADKRGPSARSLTPGSVRSFSGTPKFSSKNCFFSPVQCSFYYRR